MKWIKQIKLYFNEPFPYLHKKWIAVVVPFLCVLVLTNLVKPFLNIDYDIFFTKAVISMTMITAISSAFVIYITPLLFPKYHNPDKWTRGKFLSLALSIILISAFFITLCINSIYLSTGLKASRTIPETLLIWLVISVFFGAIPTNIIYILARKYAPKNKVEVYKEIVFRPTQNHQPRKPLFEPAFPSAIIENSSKESMRLKIHEFLYAEVLGNYVSIYYLKNGKEDKRTMRITLTQIMKVLEKYPQIVRCHRAFIVNTANIAKLQGNSKSGILTSDKTTAKIPVSRNYIKIIKEKLRQ